MLILLWQIRVEAADGDVDFPPRTTQTIVTVTVDRNLRRPVFTQPRQGQEFRDNITILETESFKRVIYRFEGTDADNRVS